MKDKLLEIQHWVEQIDECPFGDYNCSACKDGSESHECESLIRYNVLRLVRDILAPKKDWS